MLILSRQIRYNLGLTYQSMIRMEDAAVQWREALRLDPSLIPALTSLGENICSVRVMGGLRFDVPAGNYEGHRGNMTGARAFYSQAILQSQPNENVGCHL